MKNIAITDGKLCADLCRMVGLDPERTLSFSIHCPGPKDFVTVKAEFYPKEHEKINIEEIMRRGIGKA